MLSCAVQQIRAGMLAASRSLQRFAFHDDVNSIC
jgi:hypothetical protein